MYERHSHNFRLPLQADRGCQRIVDKIPRHLDNFAQARLITLQALGIFDEKSVRMLNLQIKFDRLQQNRF